MEILEIPDDMLLKVHGNTPIGVALSLTCKKLFRFFKASNLETYKLYLQAEAEQLFPATGVTRTTTVIRPSTSHWVFTESISLKVETEKLTNTILLKKNDGLQALADRMSALIIDEVDLSPNRVDMFNSDELVKPEDWHDEKFSWHLKVATNLPEIDTVALVHEKVCTNVSEHFRKPETRFTEKDGTVHTKYMHEASISVSIKYKKGCSRARSRVPVGLFRMMFWKPEDKEWKRYRFGVGTGTRPYNFRKLRSSSDS